MKAAGCSWYLAASCLHMLTNLLRFKYFFTSPCMSSEMGECVFFGVFCWTRKTKERREGETERVSTIENH
jgi:hypothetical protein